MKTAWYTRKWAIVMLHSTAWIFLFSLPFLLQSYDDRRPAEPAPKRAAFVLQYILNNFQYVLFFYLNALVLMPLLIYKKKNWEYAFVLIIIFLIILFNAWLFFKMTVGMERFNLRLHILFNFFFFLFMLAASTAYQLIHDRMQADKLAKDKETEILKTELSMLRSQVSPHFMFNVLNNMVALARKKSDQLEPSLIKLSSLMRYMLYETDEEKVPLEKEIEYLQSYIDLQQQRFGNNVKINTHFGISGNHYEIEPMLLIPFVENAFKHGTGIINGAQIDIDLNADKSLLNFSVRNKFKGASEEVKDKTSGIGLPNVKRRLNLLYGKSHSLMITQKEDWFLVSLQLYLH